jgi:hypothetical protein
MKAAVDERRRMVGDDFLEPDVPEYGDERAVPQVRDGDEELPERDPEGEEGLLAPEEHIGLTPPD